MTNTAVIQKWVKALRSGEYKQTNGTLRDQDGFCCLGVLCEVAVKEGVIAPAVINQHDEYVYAETATSVLPEEVWEWAGLEGSSPQSNFTEGAEDGWAYYELNDTVGLTFEEIADILEGQYLDR